MYDPDYEDSGTDALYDWEYDVESGLVDRDDVPSRIVRAMSIRTRPRVHFGSVKSAPTPTPAGGDR